MFTTSHEPREDGSLTVHVRHDMPGTALKLALIVPPGPPKEWLDAPHTMDWFHVSSTTGEPLEPGSNKFYEYGADGLVSRVKRPFTEHLLLELVRLVPWTSVADVKDWPVEKLQSRVKAVITKAEEAGEHFDFDVKHRKQRYMPGEVPDSE